jgi:hypothetical protein
MDEEQVRKAIVEDIGKMASDFGMDRRDLSVLMAVQKVVMLGYDGWVESKRLYSQQLEEDLKRRLEKDK